LRPPQPKDVLARASQVARQAHKEQKLGNPELRRTLPKEPILVWHHVVCIIQLQMIKR
jgi:hypothetical protein